MMTAEDKRTILDFISFYVVLGIVRMKTLCNYIGVSQRTIEHLRTGVKAKAERRSTSRTNWLRPRKTRFGCGT